jgi:hypothetical protein
VALITKTAASARLKHSSHRLLYYTHFDRTQRGSMSSPSRGRAERVSLVPYGLNQRHPNHFVEMLKVLRENRDNLGYAWRILRDGCCDGCSLGTTGMRDLDHEGRPPVQRAAATPAPEHHARHVHSFAAADRARPRNNRELFRRDSCHRHCDGGVHWATPIGKTTRQMRGEAWL